MRSQIKLRNNGRIRTKVRSPFKYTFERRLQKNRRCREREAQDLFRIVLVDDCECSRELLRQYCGEVAGLELTASFADPMEALYLSLIHITESKKKFDNNGNPSYEKHKVFLYKEDFDKFVEGLEEAIGVVKAAINGELPEKNTDL